MLLKGLLIINAFGFLLMLMDKQKAAHGQSRIPEKTLLGVALCGGSLGTLVAMYAFRHKTRHRKFYIGVPIMLAVHIGLVVLKRLL